MIEPDANAEQGFAVRTVGENRRIPEDWEGLIVSAFLPEPADPDDPAKSAPERPLEIGGVRSADIVE